VTSLKKRSLVVGAVVAALVVAGAVGTYVVMKPEPPSASTTTVKTASMEASAYVVPTNEEDDDGSDTAVPPFSDFDKNGDGAISNAEYAAHLAQLRDFAIARVNASKLSRATKADYVSRLNANFVKESGCAARLANRVRIQLLLKDDGVAVLTFGAGSRVRWRRDARAVRYVLFDASRGLPRDRSRDPRRVRCR
jgi:hypothetical protein